MDEELGIIMLDGSKKYTIEDIKVVMQSLRSDKNLKLMVENPMMNQRMLNK